MLAYLDSVLCIYSIDGPPAFEQRVTRWLRYFSLQGYRFAVSDLTWLECRVKPLREGNSIGLAEMESFLTATNLVNVPMTFAVYDRACGIRATTSVRLADALHLAAAIESKCDVFLTNDSRLQTFTGIRVQVLPE